MNRRSLTTANKWKKGVVFNKDYVLQQNGENKS